jgi:hypothetical protein
MNLLAKHKTDVADVLANKSLPKFSNENTSWSLTEYIRLGRGGVEGLSGLVISVALWAHVITTSSWRDVLCGLIFSFLLMLLKASAEHLLFGSSGRRDVLH